MVRHYHGRMAQPGDAGRRVAFFGGSFDPPHLGHLAVARAAQAALSLDTVLFAPVGAQPLKPQGTSAGFDHRLEMTRRAIAGDSAFSLSLADAPTPSGAPNYTLETLLALRKGLAPGGELFCLMGADSFLNLRHWRRAAEIPFAAPLIVASRPGQPLDGLKAVLPAGLTMESTPGGQARSQPGGIEVRSYLLENIAGEQTPFYLLPGLHVEISASDIREQVRSAAGGVPAQQDLLPAAVSDYIREHDLYR